jgi:hypothetical protein
MRLLPGCSTVLVLSLCGCGSSYPSGVLIDQIHYDKTVLVEDARMNLVSDLRQGDFDGDGVREILAVASDGIHVLSLDGKEKVRIPFQSTEAPFAVKMVEYAGKRHFLGNLPNSGKTALFDQAGALEWSVPGTGYDDPVAADLDGDGRPEVIAATASGLVALNLDGTILRNLTEAGKPLFYNALDMNGDRRADTIIEPANGKNEISIFSDGGVLLQKWTSPHPFYRFGLAPWREEGPVVMGLSDDAEELLLWNARGEQIQALKAPLANRLATPRGGSIHVLGGPGFVCLATSRGSNHQHVVYVYGADQKLGYADSEADDADSFLVLGGDGPSSFLVGGRNKIWKYSPRF